MPSRAATKSSCLACDPDFPHGATIPKMRWLTGLVLVGLDQGIQDPAEFAYRDLENPHVALFHISTEDLDTAMGWFCSDTFREATKLAKVTGRSFYLAKPRAR
jgi:hypothetical protein